MIGEDDQGTQHGSKHHYWSFGATFVLQTFLYLGSFLVKTGGVLMLHLELWMIGADDQGTQYGSKHHYWSFGAVFVFKLLLYKALFWNCGKILLSGTCPSSKDPSGKKIFWLQIFKIWVSSEVKSGSEPLFDLQEALGMTSNMAIFTVFRMRNGSKLKLSDPVVVATIWRVQEGDGDDWKEHLCSNNMLNKLWMKRKVKISSWSKYQKFRDHGATTYKQ